MKRLLAGILTLVMTVTLCPGVAAEEMATPDDYENAVDCAEMPSVVPHIDPEEQATLFSSGSWLWPIAKNASKYNVLTRGWWDNPSPPHSGVDIAVPAKTPVMAAKAGKVIVAFNGCGNWDGYGKGVQCSASTCSGSAYKAKSGGYCGESCGNAVYIQHDDGTISIYAHLTNVGVSVGAVVSKGQCIGLSGSTGKSTGPHLHFTITTKRSGWSAASINTTPCNSGFSVGGSNTDWSTATIYYDLAETPSGTITSPSGTTSKPAVSVNGSDVTVSWSYSGSGSAVNIYLIQSPWTWEAVRYSASVSAGTHSYTFENVAPGDYCAFTVARPNDDQTQSEWTNFTVGALPTVSLSYVAGEPYQATFDYAGTNADRYTLEIYKDGDAYYSYELGGGSGGRISYTLSMPVGSYSARMTAYNSYGQTNSNWVYWTVSAQELIVSVSGQHVTVFWEDSGSGNWVNVCLVNESSTVDDTIYRDHVSIKAHSKTFYNVEPGQYQACVMIMAPNGRWDSSWSEWAGVYFLPITSGTCGSYTATDGETVTDNTVTWKYDPNTKTLEIGGYGDMDDFVPPYYEWPRNDCTTAYIPWKAYLDEIETVTIGPRVRELGKNAFNSCVNLTEVKFSEGLDWIDDLAFYGCEKLSQVEFPDSLLYIGESAFEGCNSLTEIETVNAVVVPSTFKNCKNLTRVTAIGKGQYFYASDHAFEGCTALKEVTIGAMTDEMIFSGCTSLERVVFADDVNTHIVSRNAFENCTMLKEIVLPDSVKWIYQEAFLGCSSLTKIVIPPSVTQIKENVFSGCDQVTIYGVSGSAAEIYAAENHIPFIDMNAPGKKLVAAASVSTSAAGSSVVNVTVVNTAQTSARCNLLVAAYDGQGKIVNVRLCDNVVISAAGTEKTSVLFPAAKEGLSWKVFLLSRADMIPLAVAAEV